MIRWVAVVEQCTGVFGDIKAHELDGHWCERCRGTGWNVIGEPFQIVWRPTWWPWPSGSHGRWTGFLQRKRHDSDT